MYVFVFFKQKTAYEMRISDWSSDVCSSDLCLMTRIAMIALCRLVGRSLLRDARHSGHHAQRRPQHHGRPVAEEALGGGDREQRDDQAVAECLAGYPTLGSRPGPPTHRTEMVTHECRDRVGRVGLI